MLSHGFRGFGLGNKRLQDRKVTWCREEENLVIFRMVILRSLMQQQVALYVFAKNIEFKVDIITRGQEFHCCV